MYQQLDGAQAAGMYKHVKDIKSCWNVTSASGAWANGRWNVSPEATQQVRELPRQMFQTRRLKQDFGINTRKFVHENRKLNTFYIDIVTAI